MAQYRLAHIGAAALLAAAAVTTISVAQSVVASPTAASAFVPTVPCRLVDTRTASTVGTRTTPIGSAETATFAVAGTNGECTIPDAATAISTNVTAINPTAASFLSIFPAGTDRNHTSNLNWQAASPPVANQVTVGLSGAGAIDVFNDAGTVDVIIDIFGYYENVSAGQGTQGAQGAPGTPGIQGVKGDTGDAVLAGLHCTDGQTITWDDTAEAWQCADVVADTDTLAALGCSTNQSIRWDGSEWLCSFEPIVATLSRSDNSSSCCGIADVYDSYTPNVDTSFGYCDWYMCQIKILGVTDHNTCQVNVTGYPNASNAYVSTETDHLLIELVGYLPWDAAYVTISCNA